MTVHFTKDMIEIQNYTARDMNLTVISYNGNEQNMRWEVKEWASPKQL